MGKLIIDGIEVGGSSSASSVKYNNTNSTLVSTNVQGAITELNESLNELNKNLENQKRSIELLYENSGSGVNITLSKEFTNFDELEFLVHRGTGMTNNYMTYRFSKESLNAMLGGIIFIGIAGTVQFCAYTVTNTKTFTFFNNQNAAAVIKVYGIKN